MIKVTSYGDKLDLADELREEFHEEGVAVVEEGAETLLAEVQRQLRIRTGTSKTSTPPGQPPEYEKGELYRSYRLIRGRIKGDAAIAGIKSDDPKAARIEFGGTDERGIRTFPHPAVRIAEAHAGPRIVARMEERLDS